MRKTERNQRIKFLCVLLLNIILLSGTFIIYGHYVADYQAKLRQENLNNIQNMNHSAAINAISLISNWQTKLEDIGQYVELHDFTLQETLEYINESNSHEDRYFEVVGSDYKGYAVVKNEAGEFIPLSYADYSYGALQNALDKPVDNSDDIWFTPEFTDNGATALKFFGICRYIHVKGQNGEKETYVLILATRSKRVLEVFNSSNDYEGQSTVLVDSNGNYIISNIDFKSTNFFDYLYTYNELTLDQKKIINQEVKQKEAGTLFYKNAGIKVEECVYIYEKMNKNDWYCITSVPISSFHTSAFSKNYVIYAVTMLVLLLIIDVTWLQFINRKLRIGIAREMEASAEKGNFMSRMSHEIRTPLNAVIGYNTIARNELKEADTEEEHRQAEMKVMDCLDKCSIASKHLLTVINDVLDMSAIESGKIRVAEERFDFKGLITSLTTIFYSQAKTKGVEFEVIFDTLTEEWFIGDQLRTNQILTNLLSNAVKFTPEGGTVRLLISQPEVETNASLIHFEVSDTGIGMSAEQLEHVWAPFEQADSTISRRFGGTGLGLTITKSLVSLMNGKISVDSVLGKGTTFTVELNYKQTEQPDSNAVYNFESVHALVVDDDSYTCDYIKKIFENCGASCHTVTSGESAIASFKNEQDKGTPYTLCLVDWRMPHMNGLETVQKLREIADPDIPIIVITAYDFSEISDKAREVGVKAFIAKPLFQSSIFDLLTNISGKKTVEKLEKNDEYAFNDIRILLTEDNIMNMEIAKRILESTGLIVDCAKNGQEAISMFDTSPVGTYSLILMDVHMPIVDGHKATRIIRASSHPEAKTIPIIAMTADAFAENVTEAFDAGMNDHISKPIDVDVLFQILKKYLKK